MSNLNLTAVEELNKLSPEEREYVYKILHEMSSNGSSKSLDDLLYEDYEEIPVDIYTFLTDPRYLGRGLTDGEGKFTVFPYWVKTLQKIFPNNLETAYNTFIITGGVGLGKSLVAVLCMLYLLHRMLCLKDPYTHYGLQPIDKITFSLINITLDAARGVAWDKIQQLLQSSPWFLERGTLKGTSNIEWCPPKGIELIIGSKNNHVIGRAVFCNFTDEVNFGVGSDVERLKKKQMTLISQVDARMQSRFMKGTRLPTLQIIASSKNSDQSFLDSYIELKKTTESKNTLIIDEPQWVIRNDKDSPKSFYVAVGNKFLASEVLREDATEEEVNEYRRKGYSMLKVPSGYYQNFLENVDIALTDIAGIATVSSMKYISGARWNEIKLKEYQNPFTRDIIEVGDGREDTTQYSDYFDLTRVDPKMISKPLYIHLDMSISGDKTGIAGMWIEGKKLSSEGDPTKELIFRTAFSVSVKAPRGYQISFEKNREFIRWLRKQGFKIKGVSSDTFQSAQIQQQLRQDNFNTSIISVDRLQNIEGTNRKVCLPYQYFKSCIYEGRLKIYDKCDLLTEEVIGLERESSGRINHPLGGTQGSKDQVDAVCGALYNASQNAEEYSYDYGEDITAAVEVSSTSNNGESMRKQINMQFEEELKSLLDPMSKVIQASQERARQRTASKESNNKSAPYLNFGMGPAQEYKLSYLSDGIII